MEDLIFTPFQVRCPQCAEFATVSIESLNDNEEIVCPKCKFIYYTDIDADQLLKLIKAVEKTQMIPNNVS